jgi:hypothetical protein
MIDKKLIKQAQQSSEEIETIDSSWRSYVEDIKGSIVTIPFKGNYTVLVEDDSVLVEGYCGTLLIDKVRYNSRTYALKEPIRHEPFSIYGVYDNRGEFQYFTSRPEIGFHYLGMSNFRHGICTGDIEYTNPDSLSLLKEAALKIIDSFRVINLQSLGRVLLPEGYEKLKDILSNNNEGPETKLERLLSQGLIEKIL